jgi:hypothetical protein
LQRLTFYDNGLNSKSYSVYSQYRDSCLAQLGLVGFAIVLAVINRKTPVIVNKANIRAERKTQQGNL